MLGHRRVGDPSVVEQEGSEPRQVSQRPESLVPDVRAPQVEPSQCASATRR